jgi:sulfur-carrier protein
MKLLYFAWVAEAVGIDEEELVLPAGIDTAASLAAWLAGRHPVFADTARLRVAIDQQMASFDATVIGAKEVAFFPPVTGG